MVSAKTLFRPPLVWLECHSVQTEVSLSAAAGASCPLFLVCHHTRLLFRGEMFSTILWGAVGWMILNEAPLNEVHCVFMRYYCYLLVVVLVVVCLFICFSDIATKGNCMMLLWYLYIILFFGQYLPRKVNWFVLKISWCHRDVSHLSNFDRPTSNPPDSRYGRAYTLLQFIIMYKGVT